MVDLPAFTSLFQVLGLLEMDEGTREVKENQTLVFARFFFFFFARTAISLAPTKLRAWNRLTFSNVSD